MKRDEATDNSSLLTGSVPDSARQHFLFCFQSSVSLQQNSSMNVMPHNSLGFQP